GRKYGAEPSRRTRTSCSSGRRAGRLHQLGECFGGGGGTQTLDLLVMSQTSCRCSTPQRNWSQREGSNLRPNPYEGPDLPLIYSAGIGADGETLGLEPRFSGCGPEVLPLNDVQ